MNKSFDNISDFIFIEDKIEKADVILVPWWSYPELIEKASELYLNWYSDYILPSRWFNSKLKWFETEWDYFQKISVEMWVPENKILKENIAKNTFDNANYSFKILKEKKINFKKLLLYIKHFIVEELY